LMIFTTTTEPNFSQEFEELLGRGKMDGSCEYDCWNDY